MSRGIEPEVDYEQLSTYLRALAAPNRLELLRKLQIPRTSREIDLTPFRQDADANPERALSRQTVEEHLGRLKEIGLVHAHRAEREGRAVVEYELNHARLFVIMDELRRLTHLRPARAPGAETAEGAGADDLDPLPTGPALVLANGPREGQAFPLVGGGPWVVGRDTTAHVALPFDPFVSRENTRIERAASGLVVVALPSATNGTRWNSRALKPGESRALVGGDLLGVGRSLLVVRESGPAR